MLMSKDDERKVLVIACAAVLALLFTAMVGGAPAIVAYDNNVSNQSLAVVSLYGGSVHFNATANETVTWDWEVNGTSKSHNFDNFAHTFNVGFGLHNVTAIATNVNGSAEVTWVVWEKMETYPGTIPTIDHSSYNMMRDSTRYPPNMEDFGKAMANPYTRMIGAIFYLFIFGIPLMMMYIRQDNMTLPTTLLILFGSMIIMMLPPQWQIIAGAILTLGFVGILFKLYKERER